MKLVLLRVARGKTGWADEAAQDYLRRVQRHFPVEEIRLPTHRGGAEPEAAAILRVVQPRDQVIALDQRGEQCTSEGFAQWIEGAAQKGSKRLIYVIGGPFGLSPKVREQAWKTLALSRMVLNHEVARVALAEQLYRATDILRGGSYHH